MALGTFPGSVPALRILHVLRAPVGGLFRHVLDLAREQVARGHKVGLIADSTTGGEAAERAFADLGPGLALGLRRLPMRRSPHPSDLGALLAVRGAVRQLRPDVIHGHGSKGGLYARVAGLANDPPHAIRVYTPHGGSLNQDPDGIMGRLYMGAERTMAKGTDLLLFESGFIAARFHERVGVPPHLAKVVHNGVADSEFVPVAPRPDAADFLYVGELRAAKGIDTLLDAMAQLGREHGTPARAVLVGSGPDRAALEEKAQRLGLTEAVRFAGPMPARRAFELGRVLVVPSRAESLPYIVLEAAAARVPLIATDVGGIPEIFGPHSHRLIPPDDPAGLARRMADMLAGSRGARGADAQALADFVRHGFSVHGMVDAVIGAYREALLAKAGNPVPAAARMAISS